MRSLVRVILAMVLFVGLLTAPYAQTPQTNARPTADRPSTSVPRTEEAVRPGASQTQPELLIARTQAATMKEYHSSLLDTVYWALGVVVTVALLVGGFSWYSTFRVYEADKRDLRRDMEANDKQVLAEVDARLTAGVARTLEQIEAKLAALTERMTREADIARESWASERKGLSEAITKLENAVGILKQSDAELDRGLHYSETKLRRVEEHMWETEGLFGNVLLTQLQGLEAALKGRYKNTVRSILERMSSTAKKMASEKEDMSKSMVESVASDVKMAAGLEPVLTNAVLEALAKIPLSKE